MGDQSDMDLGRSDNVIPFPARGVPWSDPVMLPRQQDRATFVIRVDLDGAGPAIWRRLRLASDLTLAQLHEVLQVAMGWTDSHLHQVAMGAEVTERRTRPFLTRFAEAEGEEGIPEADVRLDQVLGSVGDVLSYEYDFGDGWQHTLRLEALEAWHPAIGDLLHRAGGSGPSPMGELIKRATSHPVGLSDDEVAAAVDPYAHLLRTIGDGVGGSHPGRARGPHRLEQGPGRAGRSGLRTVAPARGPVQVDQMTSGSPPWNRWPGVQAGAPCPNFAMGDDVRRWPLRESACARSRPAVLCRADDERATATHRRDRQRTVLFRSGEMPLPDWGSARCGRKDVITASRSRPGGGLHDRRCHHPRHGAPGHR